MNERGDVMKNLLRLVVVILMVGSAFAQVLNPKLVQTTTGCNTYTSLNIENMTVEFSGACINGLISGKGIRKIYQRNNLVQSLEGEFKDGRLNGQGTVTSADGGKYVGEWKDFQPNGQGTFTNAKGDKYVGEFKDGIQNGKGTSTYADGNKYVGEYKDGTQNGQGAWTFAGGHKYVGEFKDGLQNGQGTEFNANGSINNQGIWDRGFFVRSAPLQQATVPNQELERLRAEASEAKRKQAEAEQRLAQQQAPQTIQTAPVTDLAPEKRTP